jgi:hypothetical protein
MERTPELDASIDEWEAAAGGVLTLARRVAPLDAGEIAVDAFGVDSPDADLPSEGDPVDAAVDELLDRTDSVLQELESSIGEDSDARARATALLVADLNLADALLAAGAETAVDAGALDSPARFADTFASLADQVRNPSFDLGLDAQVVPDDVTAELEEIENAAGDEIFELATNGAVVYSATAFGSGLQNLLSGAAAEAFNKVRRNMRAIRDAFKKAATKIVAWVTGRLVKLLPEPVRDKLAEAFDNLKEKLAGGAGGIIGSGLGAALGRRDAETRWEQAGAAGKDLTEALKKVGEATSADIQRIGWVTKGRQAIDTFGANVVVGVVTAAAPWVQVAYFAAVAAVFLFVGWQLWDGIQEIGRLAP